ncbi:GNAT family N-acetyltransferase [Mariniflexile sp. HMF6888]|uniref:GNAT family N-acetyltransferase n=1 Tax=Mariniflexile sp. HMF6888 TaxID=3373086 RepID=UPI00379F5904
MDKFPEIKTSRLILAKVSFNDIPKIVEYASNKKIADTTLNIPHPYEEKDAVFWINAANQGFEDKSQFTFGIKIKISGEFIGGIGLKINKKFNRAELGYWIGQPFWNMGYATEAMEAILKFGFLELNLNKIYATHLEENIASGKVMLKNGMIKEGELKEHTKKGECYKNLIQYRLTKEEFENKS